MARAVPKGTVIKILLDEMETVRDSTPEGYVVRQGDVNFLKPDGKDLKMANYVFKMVAVS